MQSASVTNLYKKGMLLKGPLARVGRMKCKYAKTYLHFVLLTLANVPK